MKRWNFLGDEEFIIKMFKELSPFLENFILDHLAEMKGKLDQGFWEYAHQIIGLMAIPSLLHKLPDIIPVYVNNNYGLLSFEQVVNSPILTTSLNLTNPEICLVHSYHYGSLLKVSKTPSWDTNFPSITTEDLKKFCRYSKTELFSNRYAKSIRWLKSNHLVIDWEIGKKRPFSRQLLKQLELHIMIFPYAL